jgi:WD40 repeat protein
VAVTPDGRRAVSASADHTLKVWDLQERGEEPRTLTGHTERITAVAVTPDGQRAVSASADHTLKVWDLGESGKLVATFSGDGEINACAVASDGYTIVAGGTSGRVHFLCLEEA